jgi:hypothetical protein
VRNGQSFAFEKTKTKNKDGQEEEKWRQTSPSARDVDEAKVEALVSAVTGARATAFVDKAAPKGALDTPELTVTIKFEDGKKEERVGLGRSGRDAFASRAEIPDVAKLDASTLDNIVKALEALK